MKQFDLQSLVRPNIWALQPYSCARDEFSGTNGTFLDANENPFGTLNRYPDPYQRELKTALSKIKHIAAEQIFIGNGSDEIIDLIYRIFTNPGKDSVIICPPTYGMYEVSANINDVNIINTPLLTDFQLDMDEIIKKTKFDSSIKLIFVCSPNNPTGNRLKDVKYLVENFNGIVVLDEAYIDFRADRTYLPKIKKHQNLIVLQTFSKAWALAGGRVGMAYAQKEIIALMNKVKPPYNVSELNQKAALQALLEEHDKKLSISNIINEKEFLVEQLERLPIVKKIYPSDANFLLIEFSDANNTYNHLVEKKIIVRNRHSQIENCIRITVGTPNENRLLLKELRSLK
ncbi:MAG: histidinol-phosphate transaminase [Dysgonamonadaceae bacterium]|jgi:histidinol-phosphate aminotransferase|nr:histidinol-phosphate transaminase [Dysgonamonadaceae bacterium]